MLIEDLDALLHAGIPDAEIKISGEGENFNVDIISDVFEDKSKVNRQKMVLACVKENISNGEIHAFSVQAFTRKEWDSNEGLFKVV